MTADEHGRSGTTAPPTPPVVTGEGGEGRAEIVGILDGYFRYTREIHLDEDIADCADDLAALVAQARDTATLEATRETWRKAHAARDRMVEDFTARIEKARADGVAEERERIARACEENARGCVAAADEFGAIEGAEADWARSVHRSAGSAYTNAARVARGSS